LFDDGYFFQSGIATFFPDNFIAILSDINFLHLVVLRNEEIKMEADKANNTDEHLANERTFLAWVRTGIGIMAFGFVVVKFSLFVKQIGIALGKQLISQSHGYSNIIGVLLVVAGSSSLIISFMQY
jgi:uncharacterized membrane protein YidH (DUF202 family)